MPNFHTLTRLHTFKINRLKIQDNGVINNLVLGGAVAQKGSGSVSGMVTEKRVPVSRRVMLYERDSGIFFGQIQSSIDGKFTFNNTKETLSYFAIAIDENQDGNHYNLARQDLINGNLDQQAVVL